MAASDVALRSDASTMAMAPTTSTCPADSGRGRTGFHRFELGGGLRDEGGRSVTVIGSEAEVDEGRHAHRTKGIDHAERSGEQRPLRHQREIRQTGLHALDRVVGHEL